MKRLFSAILILITTAAVAVLSSCSGGGLSPQYGQYKQTLWYQMQEMINVLNVDHKVEFMEKYVDPSYVQKMGGVEAAAREFSQRRETALENALKVAKEITPTYDETAKQMTYYSEVLPVPIVFKLKNGKWYLQEDWLKL